MRGFSKFLFLLLCACSDDKLDWIQSMRAKKGISPEAAHFFVSTHPDDWQLFMGEYAYDAIASERTRVVMVVANAGDAGKEGESYWRARENGTLASVRRVIGFSLDGDSSEVTDTFTSSSGHEVTHRTLRNVSVYFLRLPDGFIKGTGSENSDFKSTFQLYLGKSDSLRTVDGVNTYALDSLKKVLSEIVAAEMQGANEVVFYLQDSGTVLSFSHSDHWATQALAEDVIKSFHFQNCTIKAFEDYRIIFKTRNLSQEDVRKKFQLLEAYDYFMFPQTKECSTCLWFHVRWLDASYHKDFDC